MANYDALHLVESHEETEDGIEYAEGIIQEVVLRWTSEDLLLSQKKKRTHRALSLRDDRRISDVLAPTRSALWTTSSDHHYRPQNARLKIHERRKLTQMLYTLLCHAATIEEIQVSPPLNSNGAFRLISVAELLNKDNPRIRLTEWYDLSFPRDGLGPSLERGAPPDMPRYSAISHVWQASEDAARRSKAGKPTFGNRPWKRAVSYHQLAWSGSSCDCRRIVGL